MGKRSKIRKKKINCNSKSNRFDSNNGDLKLNSYNPRKQNSELLRNINNSNNNNNDNSYGYSPVSLEKFENFSNMTHQAQDQDQDQDQTVNIITSQVNNRNKNRKQPNEIYEYSEEDNLPVDMSSDYDVVESSDEESNNEGSNNEESTNESSDKNIKNKPSNILTSQISEINNKISFIMNQMNTGNSNSNSNTNSPDNNIHDIILFIIFGIFVLLVLESLYKLASRVLMAKHGLNINLA